MMAAVFAMQGLGQLGAALVMLFVTLGFRSQLEPAATLAQCDGDCRVAVDRMWWTLIGLGAVPACVTLYCQPSPPSPCLRRWLTPQTVRLTIPETPRYTFDVARDVEKAQGDVKAYMSGEPEGQPDAVARVVTNAVAKETLEVPKASWTDFFRHYSKLANFALLLDTAGSWFCLDVAFYGLSLNNGTILSVIGYSTKNTRSVYDFLYKTAVGNLVIVLAGAVPGYWVSVGTIDVLGRKIQMGGFVILTALFVVMGFAYNISSNSLLAIYVLAQFFNFGTSPAPPRPSSEAVWLTPSRQGPTPPPSSCPARSSPRATAPRRTASRPRRARSAPSSARAPSRRCAPAAPPPRTPCRG